MACAGCHGSGPVKPISSEKSCPICHHRGERPAARPDISGYPTKAITIENRYTGIVADRYGPASFDHGKHVTRLRERIQDDGSHRLADRFHDGRQFVCTACHHHSPPIQEGTKPPRCTSCHRQLADPAQPESPGSPAVYHQRCVGCHQRMNVQEGRPRARVSRTVTPVARERYEHFQTRLPSGSRDDRRRLHCAGPTRWLPKIHTGNPDRYGVLVDLSLCSGCRTCEAACYEENKDRDTNRRTNNEHEGNLPPPEVPFDDLSVTATRRRPSGGVYTVVNRYQAQDATGQQRDVYRKIQCFHCDEPACASACFVSALTQDQGRGGGLQPERMHWVPVLYDGLPVLIPGYEYDKPFTPRVNEVHVLLPPDLRGSTAGVCRGMPLRGHDLRETKRTAEFANEKIVAHPDRYVHHIYGEKEVGGTSWLYLSPVAVRSGRISGRTSARIAVPELTPGLSPWCPWSSCCGRPCSGGMFYAFNHRKERLAEDEKTGRG